MLHYYHEVVQGMRLQYFILLFCCLYASYACSELNQAEIQQRIQPIGKVSLQSEVLADIKTKDISENKKELGEDTYQQFCIVCHRDGLAGAPKFRNEQDWKPRLAGKDLDDLLASSLKGLNAMPVKGTCIKCNDEDLKAAISYMLPKS